MPHFKDCAKAFSHYFDGKFLLGMEVAPEAWGGHVIINTEVGDLAAYVALKKTAGMMLVGSAAGHPHRQGRRMPSRNPPLHMPSMPSRIMRRSTSKLQQTIVFVHFCQDWRLGGVGLARAWRRQALPRAKWWSCRASFGSA